jgi:hypothetical protein
MTHHDNTGAFGMIFGLAGYIGGVFLNIIPDAPHFWQSIITAVSCAGAGWITTETFKYLKPLVIAKTKRMIRKITLKK